MPWLSLNRSKKAVSGSYSMKGSEIKDDDDDGTTTRTRQLRRKKDKPLDRTEYDDSFVDEEEPLTSEKFRTSEEMEKEQYFHLEEDLFSLMYLCRICTFPFLVGFLVFFLQIFILALALTDLTRDVPVFSEVLAFPVDVPIDIETQVVIAQLVSLVVATLKEEDIFVSLKALILVGHDDRVLSRFPGATAQKWWLSNSLRLIEGLGTVAVSFYFIVQADRVLDIFENFAAMEFISYMDNMVFKLARWGYLGKGLERMTIKVESVKHRVKRDKKPWWIALIIIFLSLTFLPMLSFWIQVRIGQTDGFYLKQKTSPSLAVWFNDDKFAVPVDTHFQFKGTSRDMTSYNISDPPELNYAFFSGTYQLAFEKDGKTLYRHDKRPIYMERNATRCLEGKHGDPTCGMFYYCLNIESWVFTIRGLGSALKETDKCKYGVLMMSAENEHFALEDVPAEGWKVWTGVIQDTVLSITADRCKSGADCSLNGACVDGYCDCEPGWSGKQCNVPTPYCYALNWTRYGDSSKDYETVGPYLLLPSNKAYERPVYYREETVDTEVCRQGRRIELYLYTGRRWSLSLWCSEDLERYLVFDEFRLEENMHAYWDNILGLDQKWFSEKTDSYSGINLQMFEIRDSYSGGSSQPFGLSFPTQGTFECLDARCRNDPHVCGRHGTCVTYDVEDGNSLHFYTRCECKNNYGGMYCQFSPFGYYANDHYKAYRNDSDVQSTTYQELFWNTGDAGEL